MKPHPNQLPEAFRKHVAGLFKTVDHPWSVMVHIELIKHLKQWRESGDPVDAIPGYDTPPPNGPNLMFPRGWSVMHLTRLRPKHMKTAN